MDEKYLTEKIIRCAFNVHNELGSGFLEKVYENALRIELVQENIEVKQQAPVEVHYKGTVIGSYCADLLVENKVLVELKAVETLVKQHEVQLVNYLKATGFSIGLLINFGTSVQIKRKMRDYNVEKD
jgi:GxxExxY protein